MEPRLANNEVNDAIAGALEAGFIELADMTIERYDKLFGYSEVTLLPISERRALIRHALDIIISIIQDPEKQLACPPVYLTHTVKKSATKDSSRYLLKNVLTNAFFLMSCTVDFLWESLPEDISRKDAITHVIEAYGVYIEFNLNAQIDQIQDEANEYANSEANREFNERLRRAGKMVRKEMSEQQKITAEIRDLINESMTIEPSDSLAFLFATLLCRQQSLQDDVHTALGSSRETSAQGRAKEHSPFDATKSSSPVHMMAWLKDGNEAFQSLTSREQQVADLVIDGLSNQQIAEKLCISEHTVKNHLRSIFQKLQIGNRSKLIAFGIHRRALSIRGWS